jgi:pyruvate formate lyase activating enzyme
MTRSPHAAPDELRIGGWEPLSLVDWPGQLAAVLFLQGCGWRCRYCHNPDLIPRRTPARIPWEQVEAFLAQREGLLDGVVFSGGEPLLQSGALATAIDEVRARGFRIGLHTGGPHPRLLHDLLPGLDWVGLDVKAPWDRYGRVAGRDQGARTRESLARLVDSGVRYEVRTTWHPSLLSPGDLQVIARQLEEAGVRHWVLQRFQPHGCRDPALCAEPVGSPPLEVLTASGLSVEVRG